MRGVLKTVAMGGVVLASLAGPGMTCRGDAPDETKIIKSPRGGILATVEEHRFEVFFYPTGVRVFPLDRAGKPVDASQLSGHATFYHPNDPDTPWFTRPLHAAAPTSSRLATSLDLRVGLVEAPRKGATVHFEIVGLESKNSSTADFTVPLSFAAAPSPKAVVAAGAVARETAAAGESAPTRAAFASMATPAPAVTPLSYVPAAAFPASDETDGYRTFGTRHRDWTTGRTNLPLSRPWLYSEGLRR